MLDNQNSAGSARFSGIQTLQTVGMKEGILKYTTKGLLKKSVIRNLWHYTKTPIVNMQKQWGQITNKYIQSIAMSFGGIRKSVCLCMRLVVYVADLLADCWVTLQMVISSIYLFPMARQQQCSGMHSDFYLQDTFWCRVA